MVSDSAKDILPMAVKNMTFLVDRLGDDCSPLQFIRDLAQNSVEDMKGSQLCEVVWDVDWAYYRIAESDSGHFALGGHVAALYQNELYELTAGRPGLSKLQSFGTSSAQIESASTWSGPAVPAGPSLPTQRTPISWCVVRGWIGRAGSGVPGADA